MTIAPEFILSICTVVASGGFAWGVSMSRSEKVMKEVEGLKSWKENHTDASMNCRLINEKTFGEIRMKASVQDELYREIIRRLEQIEKKIEHLSERRINTREETLAK